MKYLFSVCLILLVMVPVRSEEIPLNKSWGYNLPSTQDIAGIPFPENKQGVGQTFAMLKKQRENDIEKIRRFLASKSPNEPAQPGFVFQEPLNSRILMGLPTPILRSNGNPFKRAGYSGDLTLVFFSHPLSYYARLRKVERNDNQITVHYQFEPHTTPESTVHFALIPLGELPPGEYRVTYKQTRIDDKYRDMGFEPVHPDAREIVCRDFSFVVKGGEPPQREPTGAFIPLHEVWGNMPRMKAFDSDKMKLLTLTMFEKFGRDDKAGPAFVVEGTGETALARMITAFKKEPPKQIPTYKPLSLVFYSRPSAFDIHINSIDKADNKFIVTYYLVDRVTQDMTFNFALIPLGELAEGDYEVEMKQAPSIDTSGRRVELKRDYRWLVCRGTTFTVRGRSP